MQEKSTKYFIYSAVFHLFLLVILIASVEFASPMVVIENTNKQDVISAVMLGDSVKSKIVPQQLAAAPIEPKPEPEPKVEPKTEVKPAPAPKVPDVIALKAAEKKKLAEKKALDEKKRKALFEKSLLEDLEKEALAQKKLKQKKLKADFAKSLKEHAEKSLRQQLLNEDIKLRGTQMRQAQGIVNKYQALIQQAISEHWLVPAQANKKLVCLLMIRLAPGGRVLDVQITKSSGDPALDSSARAAVIKASPLPVPSSSEAFEPFRQFELKVKPENILTNDGALPV